MVCGYIYKIQFPNGKVYIGLTTQTLEKRWKEHKNCAMNANEKRVVYKALRKHNMIDTFELIEIDTAETMEELCQKEIDYIKRYDSYYKNNGYNMTLGGEGTCGYEYTEKDRQKMSDAQKKYFQDNPDARQKMSDVKKQYFEDNPDAGKLHSEKMKKHFEDNPDAGKLHSEKMKKYFEDNPDAGKIHSEKMKKYFQDNPDAVKVQSEKMKKYFEDNPDARQKMSDVKKKYFEDNPDARQKNIDIQKKYYQDNPDARQKISDRLKKYYKDNPEYRKKKSMYKPFDVFKKDGTYVKSFGYQFEAKGYLQENYGINGKYIDTSAVLHGRRNHSQGFIFKYKE